MKRILLLVSVVLCVQLLQAQRYVQPKKIVMGFYPTLADYTQIPVKYQLIDSFFNYPMSVQSAAFDSVGNLLFWSNGMTVSTLHSPYMKGGDTLSDSDFHNQYRREGFDRPQEGLIMPSPDKSYLYYLVYHDLRYEDSCSLNFPVCLIYYAEIDMRADSGRGEVVSKQNVLSQNVPTMFSGLNAVRHANGRDWWLIKPDYGEYETGGYYISLIDSMGVHPFEHRPAVGAPKGTAYSNRAYNAFSPNGEWLASGGIAKEGYPIDSNRYTGFELLRFDRCTGRFSDCHTIIPPWKNPLYWALQPIFSPSGRFLYVNNGADLFQYDMWAEDIAESATLIRSSGGYWGSFGLGVMPDSSIFICTNLEFLTIIKYPDRKGLACEFYLDTPQGLTTGEILSLSTYVPYYPNYNLGAMDCGSVGGDIVMRLYPNPAQGSFVLESNNVLSADMEVLIYDMNGRLVQSEVMNKDNSKQEFALHIASGVYVVSGMLGGEKVLRKRLVVVNP